MIIHHFILLVSLALSISSTEALSDLSFSTNNINFFRDVIKPLEIKQQEENEDGLKDMLMKKAIPLEDYNREIVAKGGIPITVDPDDEFEIITSNQDEEMETDYDRHLSGESRRLENNAEYNYNVNNEKDFSSYSFKYAKCQPVKRFSDMAAYNGEYSPLVTDYLVVFRFCPRNRCKASSKWGCSSGYGQYVIDLPSYLRAQMYYQYNKRPYLCPFCKECAFTDDYFGSQKRGRRLEDQADEDDSSSSSTTSSSATSGTYATATDDDTSSSQTYSETCTKYDFLCEGYGSWCAAYDDDDDSGKNADAPDLLDLIDYFDCVNVEGNDGRNAGYWIGPRCDSYTNKISMGIFYDPYCSQYAGNEVSINDQGGVNFDQSMFVQTYKPHCFPCDANSGDPLYGTTHYFCNKVYYDSGKCNEYLAYSVNDDDTTYSNKQNKLSECSYIDNILDGGYDSSGQIFATASQYAGQGGTATIDQKIIISLLVLICVSLSLYSCFLHHEITNLLLHKLSYQGSLGPSGRSYFDRFKRRDNRSRRDRDRSFDSHDDATNQSDYYTYATDSFSYA